MKRISYCPSCKGTLVPTNNPDWRIYVCELCGSVFFEAVEHYPSIKSSALRGNELLDAYVRYRGVDA